jgi:hypothetical protein
MPRQVRGIFLPGTTLQNTADQLWELAVCDGGLESCIDLVDAIAGKPGSHTGRRSLNELGSCESWLACDGGLESCIDLVDAIVGKPGSHRGRLSLNELGSCGNWLPAMTA